MKKTRRLAAMARRKISSRPDLLKETQSRSLTRSLLVAVARSSLPRPHRGRRVRAVSLVLKVRPSLVRAPLAPRDSACLLLPPTRPKSFLSHLTPVLQTLMPLPMLTVFRTACQMHTLWLLRPSCDPARLSPTVRAAWTPTITSKFLRLSRSNTSTSLNSMVTRAWVPPLRMTMTKASIWPSRFLTMQSIISNATKTNKQSRGFQPIGSYHQRNHMSMSMHNLGNSHPLGIGAGTPAPRAGSFGR